MEWQEGMESDSSILLVCRHFNKLGWGEDTFVLLVAEYVLQEDVVTTVGHKIKQQCRDTLEHKQKKNRGYSADRYAVETRIRIPAA